MNKQALNHSTMLLATGSLLSIFASTATLAGHDANYRPGYEGAEQSSYAKVLRSEPVVRHIEVSIPREECWKEPVQHRAEQDYTTGRTILGGIIGAAIGNQVGRGRGNDAATIAGGLAGAAIGANSAKRDRRTETYVSHETRCRTVYETRSEERIEAYDVTYRYGDQTYTTRMPYEPGKRIPVRVSVTPAQR